MNSQTITIALALFGVVIALFFILFMGYKMMKKQDKGEEYGSRIHQTN